MKVLGIDSSGMTAAVALIEDDRLLAGYSVNNKRTHSETLMPMIDTILTSAGVDISEVGLLAIAAGPGSFTGLRIGAATVKGLGLSLNVPVAAVPTCEGLAMNLSGTERLVCPIMDARRNQVYTGLYRVDKELPEAVIDQTACDISEIVDKINSIGEPVFFLGDGVEVFRDYIEKEIKTDCRFATANASLQRGASVAALGLLYYKEGKTVSVDDFAPVYLRPSQAERVRTEKNREDQ